MTISSPSKLEIWALIPTIRYYERYAQNKLSTYSSHGEWYWITEEVIVYVEKWKKNQTIE